MIVMITPETAEILGAFIGDGWIDQNKRGIYILGDIIEDQDYYDLFLVPFFNKNFGEIKPKHFASWKVYGIACYKKKVVERCVDLGFQIGKKALIARIPDSVLKSQDMNIIKAVLRGIFDTDGSFWCEKSRAKTTVSWKKYYHYSPRCQITSCSKLLIEQIYYLMCKLDIESKLIQVHEKGIKSNRNVNNAYAIRINKLNHVEKIWFFTS